MPENRPGHDAGPLSRSETAVSPRRVGDGHTEWNNARSGFHYTDIGVEDDGLELLLKELNPEYCPGSYLLKTCMFPERNLAGPEKIPAHYGQSKTPAAQLPSVALLNESARSDGQG